MHGGRASAFPDGLALAPDDATGEEVVEMTATTTLLERDLDELERRLWKPHRVLVVTNETCENPAVSASVFAHVGRHADVLVVAPAMPDLAAHWTQDDDRSVRDATERTKKTVASLERLGLHAHGQVGDADPLLAIEDALHDFPADEIVLFTWPEGRSHWRREQVAQKARERFNKRVTQVAVKDTSGSATLDSFAK
jgi:hypothetical protein